MMISGLIYKSHEARSMCRAVRIFATKWLHVNGYTSIGVYIDCYMMCEHQQITHWLVRSLIDYPNYI